MMDSYKEKKRAVLAAHDLLLKDTDCLDPQVLILANLTCEITLIRLLMEEKR